MDFNLCELGDVDGAGVFVKHSEASKLGDIILIFLQPS